MKTCPFCRSSNQIVEKETRRITVAHYYVTCMNCGARGPNDVSPERAVEMWNMRRPEEIDVQEG